MVALPVIREGEVHLSYTADDVQNERLLAVYSSLLTPEERIRHDRFRFERDRRRFLITRALIRWVLSEHTGISPEAFMFGANAWGKPEIRKPYGLPLHFNAAHTPGMVACIVALGHEVGVDVEDTTRPVETIDLATLFFSKSETEELRALPLPFRHERFFDYWTLKEAYVKGRGMGLSMPLHKFTIQLSRTSHPAVVAEPDIDDGTNWQLRLVSPTPRHRLASAVCLGDRPALPAVIHSVVPFDGA